MRSATAVVAAAITLAGCAAASTTAASSPPLRHVAVAALPEEPAHDDELRSIEPPGSVDRSDPGAVAAELIVSGLAEQGLEVVDLGVENLAATPTAATVRIAATHRAETATALHTSVYEVDLTRDRGGPWRLAGFRHAH